MLENTRFHPEEEKNDLELARQMASLADLYVNDAFGTAHRAHASTEGVTHYLPGVAGFLLEKEIQYLGQAVAEPKHPFVAILGGAKISDKIGVIRNLLGKADAVLIGGGMANTFLKAQGYDVADSLVEETAVETAKELLALGAGKLHLPVDLVLAMLLMPPRAHKTILGNTLRAAHRWPRSRQSLRHIIAGAWHCRWNGRWASLTPSLPKAPTAAGRAGSQAAHHRRRFRWLPFGGLAGC